MSTHKVALSELAGYSKLLKRMSMDWRLNTTHISMFSALFIQWQRGGFKSPVQLHPNNLFIKQLPPFSRV